MRKSDDIWVCTTPAEFKNKIRNIYPQRHYNKKKYSTYYNVVCTLDIETTNTPEDGFAYSFAMCFNGQCVVVRYVEDLIEILSILIVKYGLHKQRRIIIFVHNLGYEHMYLTQILSQYFNRGKMLLTKARKPLFVQYDEGLEFRDSLKLFQKSLKGATKGLPHEKLDGDLNYKMYRTPDTPISPVEFNYIVNDVLGLYEAIRRMCINFNYNMANIPLTNTVRVVEAINKRISKDKRCMKTMSELRLNKHQLTLAYNCMSGGDTHGTRWRAGIVYEKCNSYDEKSAHPSQQLLRKFPTAPIIDLPAETSEKDLDLLISNGYGWLGLVFVSDFYIRSECPDPTVSLSKCREIHEIYGLDNGRVLASDGALIYMDSNDYQRFKEAYRYDEIFLYDGFCFSLSYLPDSYRAAIKDFYVIKESAPEGPDRVFAKICVNTAFGASAQKVIRDEYELYSDGTLDAEKITWQKNIEKMDDEAVLKKQDFRFPFLWGLWTASLSRLTLWNMLKIVGWEKCIYWDTDSCKYEGEKIPEIDNIYNKDIIERCIDRNVVVTNRKGKTVYIGSAEDEHPAVDYGYKQFTFLHSKCYAAESWNDEKRCYEIETTIAGVGKKEGAAAMQGDISNLKDGLYIKVAGGNKLKYIDRLPFERHDFKRPTVTASFIYMTDRDYLVKKGRPERYDAEILSE